MTRTARSLSFATALVLAPAVARADWHLTPFAAVAAGGSTTFVDLDDVAGRRKGAFGSRATWLRDVVGIEAEAVRVPGYFTGDSGLVLKSGVSSYTVSAVVAVPRQRAEYTLRPYVLAGVGLLRVTETDYFNALPLNRTLGAATVGAGATGFLSEHVGVTWDLRYSHSLHRSGPVSGVSVGPESLSMWRASMGVTYRPGRHPLTARGREGQR